MKRATAMLPNPNHPLPPFRPRKAQSPITISTLDGKDLHYTATAGTLLIRDGEDDHPYGSIFYVAYTLDGADANTRPVSFLYNGGPGSATIWLHMGSFGPVRVVDRQPEPPPVRRPTSSCPTSTSLLDKTDLVFIDAPLTGFSARRGQRHAPRTSPASIRTCKAFDKFILRYITVNQRWNSPKYLFGESYGTHSLGRPGGHAQERRRLSSTASC